MADLADALAHLGATHGVTGQPTRSLLTALRTLARLDLDSPPRPENPESTAELTGAARDVAEAVIAVRVAAELVATHGPTADEVTARDLAAEWASPRPAHLSTVAARQGAWSQIADLALLAAGAADRAGPLLDEAIGRVADAARDVPRHQPDPSVQATGPAWPLPLPRGPVPDEWAGRLEEMTALSWRTSLPPEPGRAHPIRGLRLIAETAQLLHVRASAAADDPADRQALRQRAETWRAINQQLYTIHTPTEPLMPAQEYSLSRLRALAAAPLSGPDLRAGRTALAQVAAWAQTAVSHYEGSNVTGLGPALAPQQRAHLRTLYSTAASPRRARPYEQVLLANLNQHTTSPIPAGALDPLVHLYREAAQPVTPPPRPTGEPPRLAVVTRPAAAAAATRHQLGPRIGHRR